MPQHPCRAVSLTGDDRGHDRTGIASRPPCADERHGLFEVAVQSVRLPVPPVCGATHRGDVRYVCERLADHVGNHNHGDHRWMHEAASE